MSEPRVSIILPVYNGANSLAAAIKSVLAQNLADWELLIINDGSNDDSLTIARSFNDPRLTIISNPNNLGLQKTLNLGLRLAKGKYIARLDADDEWTNNQKLSKQLDFIKHHEHCVLVGTGCIVVNEKNQEIFRYLNPTSDRQIRRHLLGQNLFIHSSVIFNKALALASGGYAETTAYRHVEDYDLWLKLGGQGEFYNLPIYAVKYKISAGQISRLNNTEQIEKNLFLYNIYKKQYPGAWRARARIGLRRFFYRRFKSDWLKKVTSLFKRRI